jgi:hypothetical protein
MGYHLDIILVFLPTSDRLTPELQAFSHLVETNKQAKSCILTQ